MHTNIYQIEPQDSSVIVVTGPTGSGKSHLVDRLKAAEMSDIFFIDPLITQPGEFSAPKGTPKLVVLDHAEFVNEPQSYCAALLKWAHETSVHLLLVVNRIDDLQRFGINLPATTLEMQLLGRGGDQGIVLKRRNESRTMSFESFAAIVASLEAARAIQRASRF